jgi:hypothetical protein
MLGTGGARRSHNVLSFLTISYRHDELDQLCRAHVSPDQLFRLHGSPVHDPLLQELRDQELRLQLSPDQLFRVHSIDSHDIATQLRGSSCHVPPVHGTPFQ